MGPTLNYPTLMASELGCMTETKFTFTEYATLMQMYIVYKLYCCLADVLKETGISIYKISRWTLWIIRTNVKLFYATNLDSIISSIPGSFPALQIQYLATT